MNTSFNLSRFLKVLSNEWRLNSIKMLLFWGVMIIKTIIYFAFLRYAYQNIIPKEVTCALLFFVLCIAQGFYLQIYYHEFSSKTKTQALFLLPASRNETFWAKFLLGFILYPLFFLAYIFIVLKLNGIYNDWMIAFKNISIDVGAYTYYQATTFLNHNDFVTGLTTKEVLFLVWLFSASAYLFGTLLFKKLATFKSLAFWFCVVTGFVLITDVTYALFSGVWPTLAIPGMAITTNDHRYYCVIAEMYPKLLYGFGIFICLALTGISRIKYNEKTI